MALVPRAPSCWSCTRRILTSAFALSSSPAPTAAPQSQQIRGKKRSTRGPDSIPVRLLKDVPGYGRAGSLVPISAGHMRNLFHPQGTAAYLTPLERRTLARSSAAGTVRRDVLFMVDGLKNVGKRKGKLLQRAREERSAALLEGGAAVESEEREEQGDGLLQVEAVEPARAKELISSLLPQALDFPVKANPDEAGALYGSVTSADVAAAVRRVLESSEEAARIVIADDDVRLLGPQGQQLDRIKQVGRYRAEIRIKGTAQDESMETTANVLVAN